MSGYFAGVGGAPERQVFQQFAVAIFIAKFIPGTSFHQVDVAIRCDRAGIHPDGANTIVQALAAK